MIKIKDMTEKIKLFHENYKSNMLRFLLFYNLKTVKNFIGISSPRSLISILSLLSLSLSSHKVQMDLDSKKFNFTPEEVEDVVLFFTVMCRVAYEILKKPKFYIINEDKLRRLYNCDFFRLDYNLLSSDYFDYPIILENLCDYDNFLFSKQEIENILIREKEILKYIYSNI